MSKKIFASFAERYFEAGFSVIPLNGKVPIVSGWDIWADKEQTIDELEYLIDRYPNANIGAVLGFHFSALDIDTDDERILRAIPYSPIRRKGQKGVVSLFKKSPIANRPGSRFPIEFLNHKRQIVLPPSIHPLTNEPYIWTGDSDISDLSEVPEITLQQIETLERLCEKHKIFSKTRTMKTDGEESVCLTDAGRNNRLVNIAYAMACDDTDKEEAVERLLSVDKKEHDIPWFTDKTEPHRGKNPRLIAVKMYDRAVKSAKKRGDVTQPLTIEFNPNSKPIVNPPVPSPRGFMKIFQDYCNAISDGNQDALGLGGAVALMGALTSNKFRSTSRQYDVWPNVYVINLAHSGFGKETPQKAIEEILGDTDLLGTGNYKSGSSIIAGIEKQRERLDVIDECAMILDAMGSSDGWKKEMSDILSSLWSDSSGRFLGHSSKDAGDKAGACWNPCVNILGSTTPHGFKRSVTKDIAEKGLLPRFMIFWQKDIGEFKSEFDTKRTESLLNELKRFSRIFISTPKREYSTQQNLLEPGNERWNPDVIPMTQGAMRLITDIRKETFYDTKGEPESFEVAFRNRFAQHTAKLALLDALSQSLAEITVDSIEWAHNVVKWQWTNVKELYELATADNEHEKEYLTVLKKIEARGMIKNWELRRLKGICGIPQWKFKQIMEQMVESGNVEVVKVTEGGRPAKVYKFVEK
jgi:hypothetical protein